MKWVPLYALTAVITGLHNVYGISSIINGAPVPILNCISLVGSVILLAAAVLLPFRLRVAVNLGVVGSVFSWVFYGPLLFVSLIAQFSARLEIQSFIKFQEYVPLAGTLLGPVLLMGCTIHSIYFLSRARPIAKATEPRA